MPYGRAAGSTCSRVRTLTSGGLLSRWRPLPGGFRPTGISLRHKRKGWTCSTGWGTGGQIELPESCPRPWPFHASCAFDAIRLSEPWQSPNASSVPSMRLPCSMARSCRGGALCEGGRRSCSADAASGGPAEETASCRAPLRWLRRGSMTWPRHTGQCPSRWPWRRAGVPSLGGSPALSARGRLMAPPGGRPWPSPPAGQDPGRERSCPRGFMKLSLLRGGGSVAVAACSFPPPGGPPRPAIAAQSRLCTWLVHAPQPPRPGLRVCWSCRPDGGLTGTLQRVCRPAQCRGALVMRSPSGPGGSTSCSSPRGRCGAT